MAKTGAQPPGHAPKRKIPYDLLGDATMITKLEHAKWNRALARIRREIVAETARWTPAQIAARYPDGYPMDRLLAATRTTGVNERPRPSGAMKGSLSHKRPGAKRGSLTPANKLATGWL